MRTRALLFSLLLLAAAAPVRAQDEPAPATETDTNVNARYTVERVDLVGFDEARLGRRLRRRLDALPGGRLDPAAAEELSRRLESAYPDYEVRHRVERGSEAGLVRLVFEFTRTGRRHWIRFQPSLSKLVFHEEQGWSGVLDIQAGGNNNRLSVGLVGSNGDDLVEEYSGYWFRFENRNAGTKRVGVSLEASRFTQDWEPVTLAALGADPAGPQAYGVRRTVRPALTLALAPQVQLTAGASVTGLDLQTEPSRSVSANAALASLSFADSWHLDSGAEQRLDASYEWRSGIDALGSDFLYRRHAGRAHYELENGHNMLVADLRLGRITGRAPLFERFSLGDSTTLRGWDKFDIAPVGASRMYYQSVEYRYRSIAYFVDWGSLWDEGTDAQVRLSTGVGLHLEHFFLTAGFPLNADTVGVTFMSGIRF